MHRHANASLNSSQFIPATAKTWTEKKKNGKNAHLHVWITSMALGVVDGFFSLSVAIEQSRPRKWGDWGKFT